MCFVWLVANYVKNKQLSKQLRQLHFSDAPILLLAIWATLKAMHARLRGSWMFWCLPIYQEMSIIINVSFCNYCMLLSSFWCLCLIWCQPSLSWPSVRFDLYIDEDKAKHIDTDKGKYRDKSVDIDKAMDIFINLNFDWISKCWP